MKIYVGADHRGFEVKRKLIAYLQKRGHDVYDDSDTILDPEDDYPDYAKKVVKDILTTDDHAARGILICGSGQGMCMAANRYKGIRAALGHDEKSIEAARNDDDANVLCMPAELLEKSKSFDIVDTFLKTPFAAAPRYVRRIKEMDDM
jgi:ribose 5-phosphate isomerase B